MKITIFSQEFRGGLIMLAASIISGALAGAAAGWSFAQLPYTMPFPERSGEGASVSATSTEPVKSIPEIEVISVNRKPVEPVLPPVFSSRRASSVAGVYRYVSGSPILSDAQLVGEAVAVTTDGWFVVPNAAIEGMTLADIVLWHDGAAATPTRGILDERAAVVFLKTAFKNLSAPAFARYEDVATGIPVWVERRARNYEPSTIGSLHMEIGDLKGVPSRIAARRGRVATFTRAGDIGAPVWDMNGTLIGIASGKPGDGFTFIPSSAWAPSLYGIFSDGKILDADLGVRSVDLTALRLVNHDPSLPSRGAWVVPDKAAKLPAVEKNGPGATAGLREGDVIERIDRDILDGSADLGEVLVQYKPGSSVTLTIVRAGQTLELPVKLGSVQVSRELK